jgi:hypothetical protein
MIEAAHSIFHEAQNKNEEEQPKQRITMTIFKSGSLLVSSLLCFRLLLLLSSNEIVIDARIANFRKLQQSLNCVDSGTGALVPGFENGVCVSAASSVFFYDILQGPVSANGLQQGAPTDIQILETQSRQHWIRSISAYKFQELVVD